jgi:hypothetical protein
VAPEACIDFDAPHVDDTQVFISIFIGFSFIAAVYGFSAWTDPEGSRPVAPRSTIVSQARHLHSIGLGPAPEDA